MRRFDELEPGFVILPFWAMFLTVLIGRHALFAVPSKGFCNITEVAALLPFSWRLATRSVLGRTSPGKHG